MSAGEERDRTGRGEIETARQDVLRPGVMGQDGDRALPIRSAGLRGFPRPLSVPAQLAMVRAHRRAQGRHPQGVPGARQDEGTVVRVHDEPARVELDSTQSDRVEQPGG